MRAQKMCGHGSSLLYNNKKKQLTILFGLVNSFLSLRSDRRLTYFLSVRQTRRRIFANDACHHSSSIIINHRPSTERCQQWPLCGSTIFRFLHNSPTNKMKSFLVILAAALCGAVGAFAPRSSFMPNQMSVSRGSSMMTMNAAERTYIMIKPDGVQRGIVGNIVSRFESKGYKLAAMKTKQATAELLEEHYKDLVKKPFFPKLRDYMLSGPVVCMVWEGKEAVSTGRKMLGATNPLESAPGTIRGDFCIEVGRNICHGSDSVENAEREIGLWFEDGEVLDWTSHSFDWLYE